MTSQYRVLILATLTDAVLKFLRINEWPRGSNETKPGQDKQRWHFVSYHRIPIVNGYDVENWRADGGLEA